MRVYTAAARGDKLAGPSSPPSCAYLLHVTNLLQPAKPWGKTVAAEWQLDPDGQLPGRLQLETGQLPRRQPLAECMQQDGGSSSVGPGGWRQVQQQLRRQRSQMQSVCSDQLPVLLKLVCT